MICNNCKRAVNSKAKVCPFCGEPLPVQDEDGRDDVTLYEYVDKIKEDRQHREIDYNHKAEASASSAARVNNKARNSSRNISSVRETEPKKKGVRAFLSGLLIFILLIGAAAAAMYYAYSYFMGSSTKEYTVSIANIDDRVKKVNADAADIFKNSEDKLPVDGLLSKLPGIYSTIDKITLDCENVTAPSKYLQSHKNLEEGLKYNKLVYRQLESILKSPVDPDIQKNVSLLSQYVEQCSSSYAGISISDAGFSLPSEVKAIPSKLDPWIKQKQKDYAEVSSLMASFSKYFEDMSKLLMEYETSRVDMSQALSKTQSDNPSWDELLPLIDKNIKIVSDIKTKYIKLSVPSYLRTFNKRLGPILEEMLSYYSKLNAATKADMDFGKESMFPDEARKKADEIQALYQEADKFNTAAAADYKKLTSDIEGEKNKYMNPEYVLTLKSQK